MESANGKPDPIDLRVYAGVNGDFTLYEDEGDNYDYEHGARSLIPIHWDDKSSTLTIGAREGRFPGMLEHRTFRVVVVRDGHGTGIDPARNLTRPWRMMARLHRFMPSQKCNSTRRTIHARLVHRLHNDSEDRPYRAGASV